MNTQSLQCDTPCLDIAIRYMAMFAIRTADGDHAGAALYFLMATGVEWDRMQSGDVTSDEMKAVVELMDVVHNSDVVSRIDKVTAKWIRRCEDIPTCQACEAYAKETFDYPKGAF